MLNTRSLFAEHHCRYCSQMERLLEPKTVLLTVLVVPALHLTRLEGPTMYQIETKHLLAFFLGFFVVSAHGQEPPAQTLSKPERIERALQRAKRAKANGNPIRARLILDSVVRRSNRFLEQNVGNDFQDPNTRENVERIRRVSTRIKENINSEGTPQQRREARKLENIRNIRAQARDAYRSNNPTKAQELLNMAAQELEEVDGSVHPFVEKVKGRIGESFERMSARFETPEMQSISPGEPYSDYIRQVDASPASRPFVREAYGVSSEPINRGPSSTEPVVYQEATHTH